MKILEFRRVTFSMPVNNRYLRNRKECYHAWYYCNNAYWQDDSGQVTQRSWIDLYTEFLPISKQTSPLVMMFLNDHSEAFKSHELTLINDQYPPDFQGNSYARKVWESQEFEMLKSIAETVLKNMKKYEEMAQVKNG